MQISTVQELLELWRGVCVPFFFSGTGFGAGCQVLLSCALHSTAPGRQFWSFPLSNKETGILHWKQVFCLKLIQISMFMSQTEWSFLLTCEELMRIIWKLPPSWKKIFQPILNYVRCRQRRSLTEENGTRWIFHYAVPLGWFQKPFGEILQKRGAPPPPMNRQRFLPQSPFFTKKYWGPIFIGLSDCKWLALLYTLCVSCSKSALWLKLI